MILIIPMKSARKLKFSNNVYLISFNKLYLGQPLLYVWLIMFGLELRFSPPCSKIYCKPTNFRVLLVFAIFAFVKHSQNLIFAN